MHKDGKWAKQIISLQDEEGKWGCFHSLSQFYGAPLTTEQALRRLEILGYTMDDLCIQKAVSYMEDCLLGRNHIPDRREKVTDWNVFSEMILSAWIRRFTFSCDAANAVAQNWAEVVSIAFSEGHYNNDRYEAAYREIMKPSYGRINQIAMFYPVSLLQGVLDDAIEGSLIRYLLDNEKGIYYIHDKKLSFLPENFRSREASRYLRAIELLAGYSSAGDYLGFVNDWLLLNRNDYGKWDMGTSVNDKVYFPLSDDWRRIGMREADCTERILKLLDKIN